MSFPLAVSLSRLFVAGSYNEDAQLTSALMNGEVAGVYTISVPGSPTAGVHTVTINDVAVSYTAASGASQATVGAGIVQAMNGDGAQGSLMTASYASGTITATARRRGESLVISYSFPSGSGSATEATAASSGSFVPAGRLLVSRRTSSTGPTRGATLLETVATPSVGITTAQVVTTTIVSATGAKFQGTVRLADGTFYDIGPVAHDTNTATTATAIVTAANAALPANSVLCARPAADGVITWTSESYGEEFSVELREITGTASTSVTYTSNTAAYAVSVERGLFGIAAYSVALTTDGQGGTVPGYPAASAVALVTKGEVATATTETVSPGGAVYVGTDGRLYTSRGSGRIALPKSRASWVANINSSTAVLRLA